VPIRDAKGKVIGVLVVFSDITEYKKTENEALRRNQILQGITKVFRTAYSAKTEEDLAKKCLSIAEKLTGSQFGFIGELNAVGRHDTLAISDPGWAQCRLPHSEATVLINDMEVRGIWGRVLKEGKPFYTNDPAAHPDAVGLPEGHPPLFSFLGVPLMREDRMVGLIALANKPGGYDDRDVEAVESLAVAIARAIYSKRDQQALARQSQEIMELSTPVIQVWEGVVAAPLIGVLDSQRTMHFMERFLAALVETSSSLALLDITGVPAVDTQTAQHLVEAITAAKLLGTRVVLTGVRPAIAQTMVHLGIDLAGVDTKSSLSAGLRLCFEILGMQVSKKG
jgi:anti-anti-sigma regulatory factor